MMSGPRRSQDVPVITIQRALTVHVVRREDVNVQAATDISVYSVDMPTTVVNVSITTLLKSPPNSDNFSGQLH